LTKYPEALKIFKRLFLIIYYGLLKKMKMEGIWLQMNPGNFEIKWRGE